MRLLSDSPVADARDDLFGFRVYADAIAGLIDNPATETPLTIAVSAPWGGGKTSVARLIETRLRDRTAARGRNRPVVTCWFNAWAHADAPHLGAALAAAVAREVNKRRGLLRRTLSPLPTAMLLPQARLRRRLLIATGAVIVAVLVLLIGPLRDPVLSLTPFKKQGLADTGSLIASLILIALIARTVFGVADEAARFVDDPGSEAARGSMDQVARQLGKLVRQGVRDGRLIIFVDDLERCDAKRALQVCEVASQVLGQQHVVTVLLADMQAIATAAQSRYADGPASDDEVGRRFLEKIVQIQVALPPPLTEDMRRLIETDGTVPSDDAPAAVADDEPSTSATEADGRLVATAETVVGLGERFPAALGLLGLPWGVAVSVVLFEWPSGGLGTSVLEEAPRTKGAFELLLPVVTTSVVSGVLVFAAAQLVLGRRDTRAQEREEKIRAEIQAEASAATPRTPDDLRELEERLVDKYGSKYAPHIRNEMEDFQLLHTQALRQVEDVIMQYPPRLARGVKRMVNHARLLTQIAHERDLFDGDAALEPAQLGEWIVLGERWPALAARVAAEPALMEELEGVGGTVDLHDALERHGIRIAEGEEQLCELLRNEPRLSGALARLVHSAPSARGARTAAH